MYDTALINIIVNPVNIHIYIELVNGRKLKYTEEKVFVRNDSFRLELLYDYIKPFTNDTPYYYISLLDSSPQQGALPTCERSEASKYADLSTAQYICIDKSWMCYTSSLDLEEQIRFLGELGCDFVYSPFLVLRRFYSDKVDGKIALYAFIQEYSMTIAVFRQNKLLYGEYIDTREEMGSEEDIDFSDEESPLLEEESVDLDDIDLDDDLGDLDDLDSFDDIEELGELDSFDDTNAEELLEENLEIMSEKSEETSDETKKIERSSEDFKRFTLLQRSLARFYNDNRYESDFIENLFVADAAPLSGDFKRYVQDEMFLSVYIRKIEPEIEICQLAKEELGLL